MTTVQTQTFHIKGDLDAGAPSPPPYFHGETVELRSMASATSSLSSSSPPVYEEASSSAAGSGSTGPSGTTFKPTKSLQVENKGLPVIALPLPPRPYPIEVYAVGDSGILSSKAYQSVRPTRGSGSCILFRGDPAAGAEPICTTIYRFGPGRPPKIRLLGPNSDIDFSRLGEDKGELAAGEEEFEVLSRGVTTRAVSIRTHLGTFLWRYAGKAERREFGADSLVVMDRVTTVALAGGKTEERYRRVAQLVRNKAFRTAGSGRSTAGNGGRLMMDLSEWDVDRKGEREQMEALILAGCICMLKKEMDRRRLHQSMIIAGGGGGGP